MFIFPYCHPACCVISPALATIVLSVMGVDKLTKQRNKMEQKMHDFHARQGHSDAFGHEPLNHSKATTGYLICPFPHALLNLVLGGGVQFDMLAENVSACLQHCNYYDT
jgi:hypothetical protein